MACNTCGSSGSCGCSTVEIPFGPPGEDGADGTSVTVVAEAAGANCTYGGVKVTDGAGNITYVCTGAPGTNGTSGTTPEKYANNFTVTSTVVMGITIYSPILITSAAIIACNPLMNTCVSTPTNFDFNITVWYSISGTQWQEVTSNTSYISQIIYDTSGDLLMILPKATGTYRVVIIG
jgi:hypothetical protein